MIAVEEAARGGDGERQLPGAGAALRDKRLEAFHRGGRLQRSRNLRLGDDEEVGERAEVDITCGLSPLGIIDKSQRMGACRHEALDADIGVVDEREGPFAREPPRAEIREALGRRGEREDEIAVGEGHDERRDEGEGNSEEESQAEDARDLGARA